MGRVLVRWIAAMKQKMLGWMGGKRGYLSFFFCNSLTMNGLYRSGDMLIFRSFTQFTF